MYTIHTYLCGEDEVELICPWGSGTGNIPPPSIEFGITDKRYTYIKSETLKNFVIERW